MANELDRILADKHEAVLKTIAEGVPLENALQQHKLLYSELQSVVLSSAAEGQRWYEANLLAKASRFSLQDRDEIFSRIASGVPSETAVAEVRGPEMAEQDAADLFELVGGMPEWEERFMDAMRIAGLRGLQKLDALVADDSRDVLDCPKRGRLPNPVPTQRARLRQEHEIWKLGKFNPKLFGEQVKNQVAVQINIDHAERLARGRANAERRGQAMEKEELLKRLGAKYPNPFGGRDVMARAVDAMYDREAEGAGREAEMETLKAAVRAREEGRGVSREQMREAADVLFTERRTEEGASAALGADDQRARAAQMAEAGQASSADELRARAVDSADTAWVYADDAKPADAAALDADEEKDAIDAPAGVSSVWREET